MVVPCGASSVLPGRQRPPRRAAAAGACAPTNSVNDDDPGRGMPRGACPRRRQWSLAALLDEAAHELLGVGLEDAVDLVEDAVDVGVEVLLAGAWPPARPGWARAPRRGRRRAAVVGSAPGWAWVLDRSRSRGLCDSEPIPMRTPTHATGWRRPDCGRAAARRRPWCRAAARASAPAAGTAGRGCRRSPSPTTRPRSGRGTSPGTCPGTRPGCPPAARARPRGRRPRSTSSSNRPAAAQPVEEPLVGAHVGPLDVDRPAAAGRSSPGRRARVALQHLLLGHPVELAARPPRVALEPVEDDRPPPHDLGGVARRAHRHTGPAR